MLLKYHGEQLLLRLRFLSDGLLATQVRDKEKSMTRSIILSLTLKEHSLLAAILGFVEAGEVSGGPLDVDTPQQRTANLHLFDRLCTKTALAGTGKRSQQ